MEAGRSNCEFEFCWTVWFKFSGQKNDYGGYEGTKTSCRFISPMFVCRQIYLSCSQFSRLRLALQRFNCAMPPQFRQLVHIIASAVSWEVLFDNTWCTEWGQLSDTYTHTAQSQHSKLLLTHLVLVTHVWASLLKTTLYSQGPNFT